MRLQHGQVATFLLLLMLPLLVFVTQQIKHTYDKAVLAETSIAQNYRTISGYVYADQNKSGERDLEEKGISNVLVRILRNKEVVAFSTKTDSSGYFIYKDSVTTGTIASTYTVRIETPQGYQVTSKHPLTLDLQKTGKTIVEFGVAPVLGTIGSVNCFAELSGKQEVPPTQSIATAVMKMVSLNGSTFTLSIASANLALDQVSASHIHGPATIGVNAPPLITLFQGESASPVAFGNPFTKQILVSPDILGYIKTGITYVNIHTNQNPNGEIRGQIRCTQEVPLSPKPSYVITPKPTYVYPTRYACPTPPACEIGQTLQYQKPTTTTNGEIACPLYSCVAL